MDDKIIEVSKNKTSVDKFLEREIQIDVILLCTLLFTSLCTINVPFAIFYTAVFFHFNSYKNTDYELYNKFMLASIVMFGYIVLLILSMTVINMVDDINLHPNSGERPYFYFL
jgi:hypothetical protein